MKTIDIAKYLIVAYAVTTSPLAGIGFLGYILYMSKRLKILEDQVNAAVLEGEQNEKAPKGLQEILIQETATGYEHYKNCTIENYRDKVYRITKPSGEYLNKIFLSVEEAKREIDTVTPLLKTPEPIIRKGRRVYNIRFVK